MLKMTMLNQTPNRRGRPSVKTSVLHNTKPITLVVQQIRQSTIIYIHNTDGGVIKIIRRQEALIRD